MNYADLMSQIQSANEAYGGSTTDEGKQAAVRFRDDAIARYRAAQAAAPPPPPPGPPPPPPPPPPPAPRAAPAPKAPPPPKIVKSPNRDVVEFGREQFSQSSIVRLLFEQVGSIELVNISRRDTIEGQNPYYTLISNLSSIRKNFDPTSLISRQKSNQNISDNYSISLNNKIPDQQYLDRNNLTSFYYIDSNGDLVIELDNLAVDEIIDLEIASSGTINLVDEA
ncbi:MAG: hypothetical protein O3B35_04720 [Proteobacteria bacterium]|nr:hypothetical protein [Pseudomonadota bacterium]